MTALATPLPTTTLTRGNVQLEPLTLAHIDALRAASTDGNLWTLRVTSVPEPTQTEAYVQAALKGHAEGHMLPFAVRDLDRDQVIGCTRYHDIIAPAGRLEIGYTWYAKSYQRGPLNTVCKYLMMVHAFESLHAGTVAWRTDNFNFASQRAIERLGAKRDGVLRGHAVRRDGTIRDTFMYSVTAGEWPEIKAHLLYLQERYAC